MKRLHPRIFYISFFILNWFNTYILMNAWFHPNISHYSFELQTFLSSLIGNIGITLLVYSIGVIFLKRTKSRLFLLLTSSIIFSVLCLGMAIYANIFSTFFSFTQLSSFNNPGQGSFFVYYAMYALDMVKDFTHFVHLLPLLILILIRVFTKSDHEQYYSSKYRILLPIFAIVFMLLPIINLNQKTKGTIYESSVPTQYGAQVGGLYNYLVNDFYHYLTDKPQLPTSEEKQRIETFLLDYQTDSYINPIDNKEYSVSNQFTGIAQDYNMILIQLEAINSFVIGLEVDGIEITPNLNKLIEKSVYFDEFYSTAGIGNTSDAEFSALTGLYGNGKNLTIFDYSGSHYETLAKDFRKKGYTAFSTHGNVGKFYYREAEHLNTLGFSHHYDLNYYLDQNPNAPLIHSYLDDFYFLEHFTDLFPSTPFFGFAIAVTSHSPYVSTSQIKQHHFKGLTKLASSYLDFCIYVDQAIGNFISVLEEKNILENSVIAFYGDHTSSLFQDDLESILKKKLSKEELRMTLQSVPFLIYQEDLFAGQVSNKIGGTVDIYRTLSNLFGLDSKYHFGSDLLTDEPNYIYSPRNLDIITPDGLLLYPSKSNITDATLSSYVKLFEHYKKHNDLILKTYYFR